MNQSDERTGLDPRRDVSRTVTVSGVEEEEPPGKPRRHPQWRNVPAKQWDDWRWQSQNAIRSVRQLRDLLPFTPEELEAIGSLEAEFKLAIPPYYFSLIDVDDPNDPIRLQSVTSPRELESKFELADPLEEEKDSPVPGLTHRYEDRALLVTTHVCTMYCRFCTRKRATMVRGGWDSISRNDERMIEYVRDHPEIRDVIVSGGDPLTLPLPKLRFFLESLKAIKHVDVVRIGSLLPFTLEQNLY
jgi:lysine 2,3-aminomutase